MVVREPKTNMMMADTDHDEDSSCSSDPQRIDDFQRKRRSEDADDEKELKRRKNRGSQTMSGKETATGRRSKSEEQGTGEGKLPTSPAEGRVDPQVPGIPKRDRPTQGAGLHGTSLQSAGTTWTRFCNQVAPFSFLQRVSPQHQLLCQPRPQHQSWSSPKHTQPACAQVSSHNHAHDVTSSSDRVNNRLNDRVRGARQKMMTSDIPTTVTTLAPAQTTQPNLEAQQRHYLRVRNKDGTHKILCLDHENYLKVMQRLKAQRAAAALNAQSKEMQASASTVNQSQHLVQARPEPQAIMNTNFGVDQPSFSHSQVEEQVGSPKRGQKLDTCEDLISILKGHVKANGHGFELMPVKSSDVSIKQELVDADYEQNFLSLGKQDGLMDIKQENLTTPDSSGAWTSTGQHIRQGMDLLTNQDDISSTSAHIQNIVQYLERDEHAGPVTVTADSTEQLAGQTARQNGTINTTSRPPRTATYVTSSSLVGSLHKENDGGDETSTHQAATHAINIEQYTAEGIKQKSGLIMPVGMENVKLRASAADLVTSTFPMLGGQPQTTTTPTGVQPRTGGLSPRTPTVLTNKVEETRLQPIPISSLNGGSLQTSQGSFPQNAGGSRLQTASTQQQSTAPSACSLPFRQQPPSSTIDTLALASLQFNVATSSENLISESTSQITQYLNANSIETLNL